MHATGLRDTRACAGLGFRSPLARRMSDIERIVKAMPDNLRRVTGLDKSTTERREEFLEDLEREAVPHAVPGKPFLTYDARGSRAAEGRAGVHACAVGGWFWPATRRRRIRNFPYGTTSLRGSRGGDESVRGAARGQVGVDGLLQTVQGRAVGGEVAGALRLAQVDRKSVV